MLDWLFYFATGFPLFWGVGVSVVLIAALVISERALRHLPDAPPPRPRGTTWDYPHGIPSMRWQPGDDYPRPEPPTRCVVTERKRRS